MNERVEIFLVDEEGILLRAYTEEAQYYYDGDPEEPESPLIEALKKYYKNHAPSTMMALGFETPAGTLIWQSELASPYGDDGFVEIGERLYLENAWGERVQDEYAYEDLAKGEIPVGWISISR
jgi:hypothetical protein